MLLHNPVEETQLKHLIGEPVYAALNDGSIYYGIVDSVKGGQLFLRPLTVQQCPDSRDGHVRISGLGLGLGFMGGALGLGLGLLSFVVTLNRFRYFI
ncbi:hypothetical protein SD70_12925 [Gordoniibacillus kamchatkensis]|uniref:Uncharacterized protein n=1 Tax=Gordoniibacillus kamchatkensis TaxID=1590651 RepID=A0ABR5AHH7_9BACL|nr:hypothetical protein [Paenibacillus sp. VKM B-2647]KIL40481.1 hypothetical protein SD70_12925 [Paenibacillus sp. VKM B-2647]